MLFFKRNPIRTKREISTGNSYSPLQHFTRKLTSNNKNLKNKRGEHEHELKKNNYKRQQVFGKVNRNKNNVKVKWQTEKGNGQRPTGNRQQTAGKWQRVNGKWQMAKGSVGKNTFWPGHAPWATASSGVPAGAQHKLSLARDLPASLRRRQKQEKKEKPFSKFNYKYFSAVLFASVVFYPRFLFFLCFECSEMFSDFLPKCFPLSM